MTNEMEYVLKEMQKIREDMATYQKTQILLMASMNNLLPESERIACLNQAALLSRMFTSPLTNEQNLAREEALQDNGYETLSTDRIF